jgi:hypothetical protein
MRARLGRHNCRSRDDLGPKHTFIDHRAATMPETSNASLAACPPRGPATRDPTRPSFKDAIDLTGLRTFHAAGGSHSDAPRRNGLESIEEWGVLVLGFGNNASADDVDVDAARHVDGGADNEAFQAGIDKGGGGTPDDWLLTNDAVTRVIERPSDNQPGVKFSQGNWSPNIGRPLFDSASVASS